MCWAWSRAKAGCRVLMYHRVRHVSSWDQLSVSPEAFEHQLQRLTEIADVVDLDTALAPDTLAASKRLRVAITFDDGYLDNFTNAVPLLRRLGLPATFFVTTRFADQVARHPRYVDEPGRLHMDWDEVCEVARTPRFDVGSHTLSHPLLTALSDSECRHEITESKNVISERLGRSARHFCYPSGDRSPREHDFVRQAGYQAAVTVSPGRNGPATDPMLIRRTEMTDRDVGFELECKLWGACDLAHRVLDVARLRRSASRRLRPAEE